MFIVVVVVDAAGVHVDGGETELQLPTSILFVPR
jgi:hypothetical protein